MKKLFKTSILLTLSIGTILLVACRKDVVAPMTQQKVKEPRVNTSTYKMRSLDEINSARTAFARTLAIAIREEGLRQYIHARMQERLKSDYEMVYIAEKNKVVSNGKTLAQILTSAADAETLSKYGQDFFDKVTDISPLLAISMPELEAFDASKWNISYVPDVAAILELTPANNNRYTLFGAGAVKPNFRSDAPTDPTLTVWDAESMYLVNDDGFTHSGIEIDNFMPSPPIDGNPCDFLLSMAMDALNRFFVDGNSFHLVHHNRLMQLYSECVNGPSGGGPTGGCTQPCERDCETLDETLVDFNINDWGVYRNIDNQWFESNFVFHANVVGAERSSFGNISPFTVRHVTRAFKKREILNCSTPICSGIVKTVNFRIRPDWNIANFADQYVVAWSEVDNGTQTFSVSIPLSAKFKVGPTEISAGITPSFSTTGAAIVDLGSQAVFYCDRISRTYNTGSITFHVN